VKLITGEDVVAEISEDEANNLVVLKKPCMIMMVPQGNNQFGIAMAPYLPFAKNATVPIRAGAITSIYEPDTELLNEYNTRFGSGLVVPPAMGPIVMPPGTPNAFLRDPQARL
jgi:hypothetical protein